MSRRDPKTRRLFSVGRWVLCAALGGLLFASAPAFARGPSYGSASPKQRAGMDYNRYRKAAGGSLAAAQKRYGQFERSGNPALLDKARGNLRQAMQSKVSMLKAQQRGLMVKADKALNRAAALERAGDKAGAEAVLQQALGYEAKAKGLNKRITRLSTKQDAMINRYERMRARGLGGAGSAEPGAGVASQRGPRQQQSVDMEPVPGVDAPAQLGAPSQPGAPRVAPIKGRKGWKMVKGQMSRGNIMGAMATLQRMEAQGRQRGFFRRALGHLPGVGGFIDPVGKAQRHILKNAYKMGKDAAKMGDLELAQESLAAVSELGKPGRRTNGKIMGIGNAALDGAKQMSKQHRIEDAYVLIDFARQIQTTMGRQAPTRKFRKTRDSAMGHLWKDIKSRAKEGNMEAFRSAMRLANAYAQEDGRRLNKGELKTIRKYYRVAQEKSVGRALEDAKVLLSGRLGYVNVEEAAKRLAYAEHTADKLEARGRGHKLKTGIWPFRRGLGSKFKKTRQMLVKAFQEQNNGYKPRPGLMKRIFEKWWKQEYRRTPPSIAPVDQVWEQNMARAQQREQIAQLAAQNGVTPQEMMQILEAQQMQQMQGGGEQMGY
jgi:hypothetical protein